MRPATGTAAATAAPVEETATARARSQLELVLVTLVKRGTWIGANMRPFTSKPLRPQLARIVETMDKVREAQQRELGPVPPSMTPIYTPIRDAAGVNAGAIGRIQAVFYNGFTPARAAQNAYLRMETRKEADPGTAISDRFMRDVKAPLDHYHKVLPDLVYAARQIERIGDSERNRQYKTEAQTALTFLYAMGKAVWDVELNQGQLRSLSTGRVSALASHANDEEHGNRDDITDALVSGSSREKLQALLADPARMQEAKEVEWAAHEEARALLLANARFVKESQVPVNTRLFGVQIALAAISNSSIAFRDHGVGKVGSKDLESIVSTATQRPLPTIPDQLPWVRRFPAEFRNLQSFLLDQVTGVVAAIHTHIGARHRPPYAVREDTPDELKALFAQRRHQMDAAHDATLQKLMANMDIAREGFDELAGNLKSRGIEARMASDDPVLAALQAEVSTWQTLGRHVVEMSMQGSTQPQALPEPEPEKAPEPPAHEAAAQVASPSKSKGKKKKKAKEQDPEAPPVEAGPSRQAAPPLANPFEAPPAGAVPAPDDTPQEGTLADAIAEPLTLAGTLSEMPTAQAPTGFLQIRQQLQASVQSVETAVKALRGKWQDTIRSLSSFKAASGLRDTEPLIEKVRDELEALVQLYDPYLVQPALKDLLTPFDNAIVRENRKFENLRRQIDVFKDHELNKVVSESNLLKWTRQPGLMEVLDMRYLPDDRSDVTVRVKVRAKPIPVPDASPILLPPMDFHVHPNAASLHENRYKPFDRFTAKDFSGRGNPTHLQPWLNAPPEYKVYVGAEATVDILRWAASDFARSRSAQAGA